MTTTNRSTSPSVQLPDLSEPVLIDGELPNPEESEVIAARNGEVDAVDVAVINDRVLQAGDEDGLRLTISAVDEEGELLPVNPQGVIEITRRQSFSVSGRGLLPNSPAVAWLFSTPIRLGTVKVGKDGSFASVFTPSRDIGVGEHTVQVNGIDTSGSVRSVNVAVVINEPSVATITTFDIGGPSGGTPSSTTDVNFFLVIALAVSLAIGGWLLILLLRRRAEDEENGFDKI